MIDDRDLWQAAVLLVKRYGDDACSRPHGRAETWRRILNAIERLQARARRQKARRCTSQPVTKNWQVLGT